MIGHYFKIAFVNLQRQRWFSLINIVGLAMGISLCLVIITILINQLSFDSFHPAKERVYRINTEAKRVNGDRDGYATTAFPVGRLVKEQFSYIQEVVRLHR